MVAVGDKDKVLPEKTARAFETKMKNDGNDCTVTIYPGGEHSFFNYGYAKKMGYPPNTINRYYYEVLQQMDDFLTGHSFLAHHARVRIPKEAVYPVRKKE